ncbi:MAG: methyl-accepting chemotaxis protein [Lachnospiraceae bacterium]|nr:methyl-accepting chemotaxis protein [Lachnospiraceae bacterium]
MEGKKLSFATNINQLICVGFGIAFLIIYIASAVLLFITEPETEMYYLKAIGMFFLYLLMYAICVWYMSRRIERMFEPLDQIAHALMEDKIRIYGEEDDILEFANGLKSQMEKMQILSEELESAKGSLEDFYEESRQNMQEYDISLDKCADNSAFLSRRSVDIKTQLRKNIEKIDEMIASEAKVKKSQDDLHSAEQALDKSLKDIRFSTEDTREDFSNTKDAYLVLGNMLSETTDLIENLFAEITAVQSIASQINLYSVNASLDIARGGIFPQSNRGALEDIKDLAAKMIEKTDEISILVIRCKNSTKLALDQASFCEERQEEAADSFGTTKEKLSELNVQMKYAMDSIRDVRNFVSEFSGSLYELQLLGEKQCMEMDSFTESAEKLNRRLNRIQQSMKNG